MEGVVIIVSLIILTTYICIYFRRLAKTALPQCGLSFQSSSTTSSVNMSSSKPDGFSWIKNMAPVFPVDGNKIKVLHQPSDFFKELKSRASTANHRIVIASLYVGTGKEEQELIDCIHEARRASEDSDNKLEVNILLDYTRGSRGEVNSRTMLLPLLGDEQVHVSLYHTPHLRGWLKWLMPPKFNETIGLQHMKIYLFDDTIIMSGANLSTDYFSNRQDRYVVLQDCPQLADFYSELVHTTASFSLQLQPDDTLSTDPDFPHHPYQDPDGGTAFKAEAKRRVTDLLERYRRISTSTQQTMEDSTPLLQNNSSTSSFTSTNGTSHIHLQDNNPGVIGPVGSNIMNGALGNHSTDNHITTSSNTTSDGVQNPNTCSKTRSDSDNVDTWVCPLVQMGQLGVFMDNFVTEAILVSPPEQSNMYLASGYFNLTSQYMDTILLNSKAKYSILTAHPKANGFFTASGILGAVPYAYTRIAGLFHERVASLGQQGRVALLEYQRPGWTFHSKGLWYYPPGEHLPTLTLVGSPNFGYRSVYRDLETQVAIITNNTHLRQQLLQEQRSLYSLADAVTSDTFTSPDRYVPLWARLVTRLIKTFT